jgi:hypothetical protein
LICVLLRERPGSELFSSAVEPFQKALAIMQGLTPAFAYARHTLARLRPNLTFVERRLAKEEADSRGSNGKKPANGAGSDGLEFTSAEESGFSQPLEDLLRSQMMPDQFTMDGSGVNGIM